MNAPTLAAQCMTTSRHSTSVNFWVLYVFCFLLKSYQVVLARDGVVGVHQRMPLLVGMLMIA